jgi:hypothetical protein
MRTIKAVVVTAVLLCSRQLLADPSTDWVARSTAPGVVMAVGFDTQSEVSTYTWPDSTANHVSWEQGMKASGNGSMRMNILKTDAAGSGSWMHYLANDQREFKTGNTFYVQFRQYFPQYYANHSFKGTSSTYANGWKQAIISNHRGSNQLFEVVLQNTNHRSLVQGYNRNSDGSYLGWETNANTKCSSSDFVYQNKIDRGGVENTCLDSRRKRGGLYSYGNNKNGPDPETGAFIFYPDEWLTFLVKISPGTFGGGTSKTDTNIQVWAARASATSYTLLNDVMVNLGAESGYFFDAIWLLPYNTERAADPTRSDTFTLYDELIVSTNFIQPPNSGDALAPRPPTSLAAQ